MYILVGMLHNQSDIFDDSKRHISVVVSFKFDENILPLGVADNPVYKFTSTLNWAAHICNPNTNQKLSFPKEMADFIRQFLFIQW